MKIKLFVLSNTVIVVFIGLTIGQELSVHAMNEKFQEPQTTIMHSKNDLFNIVSEDFWILKNREAFLKASYELISEQGEWKGACPYAKKIQYTGTFTKEDLPLLEKWLSLKSIQYFSLTDTYKSADYNIIYSWYNNLIEKPPPHINFEKLIWLKKSSIEYQNQRQSNDLPEKWLKSHNQFYGIK